MNNFLLVWLMGMKIDLMQCVVIILLGHECLTVVAFILGFTFRVHIGVVI